MPLPNWDSEQHFEANRLNCMQCTGIAWHLISKEATTAENNKLASAHAEARACVFGMQSNEMLSDESQTECVTCNHAETTVFEIERHIILDEHRCYHSIFQFQFLFLRYFNMKIYIIIWQCHLFGNGSCQIDVTHVNGNCVLWLRKYEIRKYWRKEIRRISFSRMPHEQQLHNIRIS